MKTTNEVSWFMLESWFHETSCGLSYVNLFLSQTCLLGECLITFVQSISYSNKPIIWDVIYAIFVCLSNYKYLIACHFVICDSNWRLTFCLFCFREANYPSRREIIQYSSHREHESQSGWFWIRKAWSSGVWSNTYFYQSERDSWLPRSWVHEDLSTHPQEWCLLIWGFTYRDSDRTPSCGFEEICWRAGDT